MTLIAHDRTRGSGQPIVFVHGFGCARSDWAAQMKAFAGRHDVVAVDLRAHGATPGQPEDCTMERYGADIAELLTALDLSGAVLIGHSMGCRVVSEAALQAPYRTRAIVHVDGSQFAAAFRPNLDAATASAEGYATVVKGMFAQMFNEASDPSVAEVVRKRATNVQHLCGRGALLDMLRYDVTRLETSLASLAVPVLALQTTFSNERRERKSLTAGATTPYLDMLRRSVRELSVAVLPGIGHFPQLDAPAETNGQIEAFMTSLAARA